MTMISTPTSLLSEGIRRGCARITAMGFFRGFAGPFRGAAFVSRERLWHLVVFPVLLNVALAGGAAWAAGHYWRRELADRAIGSPALATLLLVITTTLGAIVLFVLLQPVLGAIFNDRLSERVEHRVAGEVPKVPFFASVGRAVVHGILKLVLYGVALVAGLSAGAVTAGLGAWWGWASADCSWRTTGSTTPCLDGERVLERNGDIWPYTRRKPSDMVWGRRYFI